MIKFYGDFQLVKIIKESTTKKDTKSVMFNVASNRYLGDNKKETDFIFCQAFGKVAEALINNLPKDEETGKYKSRRMLLEGEIKTYKTTKKEEFQKKVKPSDIPEEAGTLNTTLNILFKKPVETTETVFVVRSIHFLDNKYKTANDEEELIVSVENDEEETLNEIQEEIDKKIKQEKETYTDDLSQDEGLKKLTQKDDSILNAIRNS